MSKRIERKIRMVEPELPRGTSPDERINGALLDFERARKALGSMSQQDQERAKAAGDAALAVLARGWSDRTTAPAGISGWAVNLFRAR